MEKAIIIQINAAKAYRKGSRVTDPSLAELNEHLAAGWRVKEMSPTSGAYTSITFCLVILTKD